MIIIPLQVWGIGDVIWEQTIVNKLAEGDKILWPVEPEFVEGLNRAYPHILFIHKNMVHLDHQRRDDYEVNGCRVLPLRWADTNLKVPYTQCMSSKYDLYNMDYRDWKENAMWHRDSERENALFKLLGCDKEPYAFVNTIFGSQSQLRIANPVAHDLPVVEMRTIPGFSLFDWAKVIEGASYIHSVSTSIIYILELLVLQQPIHLYVRKPIEQNFDNVEYILKSHDYILHL
jgi:hypothetical protein